MTLTHALSSCGTVAVRPRTPHVPGNAVEVEYVSTGECSITGNGVEVVRLLRSRPAVRQHARRQTGGVKRAVTFEVPAARKPRHGESDSDSDSEGNSSDGMKQKQRRVTTQAASSRVGDSDSDSEGNSSVVAAALAALFGDDGLSDSEDSNDDEDEDAAQTTRTAAQLHYERIPLVEDVVVGMRVMGHWNDIDGWYPAEVIHVYAGGDVKFRIRYDGDDEESDVGNERLGQMV